MENAIMKRRVKINDTTLRDGEQAAGFSFTAQEKLRLARILDSLGVDEIEAGIPVMGGSEAEALNAIVKDGLRAEICGWNRARKTDINASGSCGLTRIHVSVPVSDILIKNKFSGDRTAVLNAFETAIRYAREERGMEVSAGLEDAGRAEPAFLLQCALLAEKTGAFRVRFCDTTGCLDPLSTYEKLRFLVRNVSIPVEVHAHDDLGMATANAFAGVRAGASGVSVTLLGMGERAGNAALEETAAALSVCGYETGIDLKLLSKAAEALLSLSGTSLPPWKAVVGKNAFSHESGIHTAAIIEDAKCYEVLIPQAFGVDRRLVLGKHSGRHHLKRLLEEEGWEDIPEDRLTIIMKAIKRSFQKG